MTEDEAKTKSCCGPMQAEFGKTHVVNCIGSACMAWRETPDSWVYRFREWMEAEQWIEAIKTHRNGTGSTLKDAKDLVDGIRSGTRAMPSFEKNGYCGLAGKP